MRVQRKRRSEDDEEHHQIGKERPDTDIDLSVQDFRRSCTAPLDQGVSAHRLFFLDFLGGLPEEEIRTDRSSEDCDQRRPRRTALREPWNHCRARNRAPVGMKTDCREDVREEHQREPLERIGEDDVSKANCSPCDEHTETDHPQV